MFRRSNHNIFAGDRAYQTTFFLNFKSSKSEQKYQSDTSVRTKYFLYGYIIVSLLYLIWNFFNSVCFNFYHDCKHTYLLIASMLCLISAFPVIKVEKPISLRLLLIVPSLYTHLLLIDTYSYHLAIHFIVIQTVITSIFENIHLC